MRPRSIVHCPLSILLLAALGPRPAAADLSLLRNARREITTFSERTLKYAGIEHIRIQPEKVRIANLTLGQVLIVRLDQKKLLVLDVLQHTQSVVTFEQIAARRRAAMDDVRDAHTRVQDTPEAARLASLLRGFGMFLGAPPQVERRATGEKATIAGREAARVQIVIDGETRVDVWAGDGPEEARWYYEALAALQAVPPEAAEALRACGGIPLREDSRYALFLDRVRVQAEVTLVDTGPIPAAEFEAPSDFRTVPFDALPDDAGRELPGAPPPAPAGQEEKKP